MEARQSLTAFALTVLCLTCPPPAQAERSSAQTLIEAGWSPAPTGATVPRQWELEHPRLPVYQGAALLLQQRLPRPALTDGKQRIDLPLASKTTLLARDESGSEPLMIWTVDAQAWAYPGGVLIVDMDVLPYGRELWPPLAPKDARMKQRARPVIRPDPGRIFKPKPRRFAREDLIPPELLVRELKDKVHSDMLLATTDRGKTWLELTLGADTLRADSYLLASRYVFGAEWKGKSTLFLAPAPRSHHGVLELFAVLPSDLTPRSLGTPNPDRVGWAQEVTDLRVLDGDVVEVLTLHHDDRLRVEGPRADSWGARLQLHGEKWVIKEQFAVGGDGHGLSLRFEDAKTMAISASYDGKVLARRAP